MPVEFCRNSPCRSTPIFLGVWLGGRRGGANCRITGQDAEIIDYLHEYADELGMQVDYGAWWPTAANSYGITRGAAGRQPWLNTRCRTNYGSLVC